MRTLGCSLLAGLGLAVAAAGCGGSSSTATCGRTVVNTGSDWFVLDSDLPSTGTLALKVTFALKASAPSSAVFDAAAADTLQIWSSPSATDAAPTFTTWPAGQTIAPGEQFTYELTLDLSTLPSGDHNLGLRPTSSLGTMGKGTVDVVSSCGRL